MKRLFLENFWWKMASVLMAVALWMTLVSQPDVVSSASVPVFFRNLPADLEFASLPPDRLVLEIRGPAGKLSPEVMAETAAQIDLASVKSAGERTFTIDRTNISLPFGVTFERSVPSQMRLRFDRRLSKEVAVRVRFAADPPSGWRIARNSVTPERVRIVGPASRVDQIEAVETDRVDLVWQDGEQKARVHVFAGDPQVRLESSPMVLVNVDLARTQD